MEQQQEVHAGGQPDAALRALADQLRGVAARAGRADVVAKADEVLVLLSRADGSAGGAGTRRDQESGGDTVVRILNGLGF